MNIENQKALASIAHIVRVSLPQGDPTKAIDVTAAGNIVLNGKKVFIDADAYSLAIGEVATSKQDLQLPVHRARLLDLLCAAHPHMNTDHCGYFEHWLVGRHSVTDTAVLYRFSVFESSRHQGAWLITQSSI